MYPLDYLKGHEKSGVITLLADFIRCSIRSEGKHSILIPVKLHLNI